MASPSDIVTTRTLTYTTNEGDKRDFVLTIFEPTRGEFLWECRFTFSSPFDRKFPAALDGDYIGASLSVSAWALEWLRTYDLGRTATWKGRPDCGLPTFVNTPTTWTRRDIPPPSYWDERLEVLGSRGFGDGFGEGSVPTLLLTFHKPFQVADDEWKCGITLNPAGMEPKTDVVYYGVGADYMESLLDAASIARAILEWHEPKGSAIWNDLMASDELPYKVGASFLMDTSRVPERNPSRRRTP